MRQARRIPLLVLSLVMLVSSSARAQAQSPDGGFTEREKKAIEEALHAINIEPSDLSYRKGPIELTDPSRLPLVDKLLHDPLAIPAISDTILSRVRRSTKPSELVRLLAEQLPGGEQLTTDDLE